MASSTIMTRQDERNDEDNVPIGVRCHTLVGDLGSDQQAIVPVTAARLLNMPRVEERLVFWYGSPGAMTPVLTVPVPTAPPPSGVHAVHGIICTAFVRVP